MPIDDTILTALRDLIGAEHVSADAQTLRQGSKDFYWFSPLLKPLLDGKQADVIVRPGTVDEVRAVVQLAVRQGIPLTARGAGTGNYGQGVPMHGGIMLNLRRLDRILELTTAAARVEAGTLLNTIEQSARTVGAELRFYPSTLLTATAGGFLGRWIRRHWLGHLGHALG